MAYRRKAITATGQMVKDDNVKWKTQIPGTGWSSSCLETRFITSVINDKAEENAKPKQAYIWG